MAVRDKHNNKENKFKIKILGEKMVVNGAISEGYILKLAEYINQTGEEILSAYPRLPRRYLLSLTLVNITDELFKTRKKLDKEQNDKKKLLSEREKMKQKIDKLIYENKELNSLLEEVDD